MRFLLVCILAFSTTVHALSLRDDYPKKYVIKPGDSLWSIANQFLQKPWQWKALWHANPQVKNPDRLYPGAVLTLNFDHNKPFMRLLTNGTIKLSPHMRSKIGANAIPAIALNDIQPFLSRSWVFDCNSLCQAPYVVSFLGERLRAGQGDQIYVKNLHPGKQLPIGEKRAYAVFRPDGIYKDAHSEKILGYKSRLIGYGELQQGGEPAVLLMTDITTGVKLADKVIPNHQPYFDLYFEPKEPKRPICGNILDLLGENDQGATGFVAVIDKGKDAALEAGDVLAIYSKPKPVPDPLNPDTPVLLPAERLGEAMIFRTFSHTSFALIVHSTRAIHSLDEVTNP